MTLPIRKYRVDSSLANSTLPKLTIQNGSGRALVAFSIGEPLTVSQSTITGNSTGSEYSAVGGGIYNTGTLTLNSGTLTKNAVYALGCL